MPPVSVPMATECSKPGCQATQVGSDGINWVSVGNNVQRRQKMSLFRVVIMKTPQQIQDKFVNIYQFCI
jgi:hypothetical protein